MTCFCRCCCSHSLCLSHFLSLCLYFVMYSIALPFLPPYSDCLPFFVCEPAFNLLTFIYQHQCDTHKFLSFLLFFYARRFFSACVLFRLILPVNSELHANVFCVHQRIQLFLLLKQFFSFLPNIRLCNSVIFFSAFLFTWTRDAHVSIRLALMFSITLTLLYCPLYLYSNR